MKEPPERVGERPGVEDAAREWDAARRDLVGTINGTTLPPGAWERLAKAECALRDAVAALSSPSPVSIAEAEGMGGWRPTHRHYKGGLYRVIARAKHTETREMLTIYDDGSGNIWARPSAVFDEYIMEVGPRFLALPEPPRWPPPGYR